VAGAGPTPARRHDESPQPVPFPVPLDVRSVALTGIFLLAVIYTLYFARSFIIPLVVVLLLDSLFSPVVRRFKRAGLPDGITAALIVLALVGTLGWGLYRLSGPAADWVSRAPESLKKVESKLRDLRKPVEQVSRTAAQVERLTDMDASRTMKVELKGRTLMEAVFGSTQAVVGATALVLVLLYFTLASGDLFLSKVIKVLPTLQDKKRAVQIARETEDQISSYLTTVTIINIVFGAMVALAMSLLGMPNPMLWGVIAAVTNYIPYLGAVVSMIVLGLAALLHFETAREAALVPATFFALNLLEGYLLTPIFVGRQLALNPVVVFIGVLFWGWIWGVLGALLAVPILATLKIVCDHIEGLAPIGEFLGS
jgi:predicted PurR-regulated permease PerM